jgi:hypothetical protein
MGIVRQRWRQSIVCHDDEIARGSAREHWRGEWLVAKSANKRERTPITRELGPWAERSPGAVPRQAHDIEIGNASHL